MWMWLLIACVSEPTPEPPAVETTLIGCVASSASDESLDGTIDSWAEKLVGPWGNPSTLYRWPEGYGYLTTLTWDDQGCETGLDYTWWTRFEGSTVGTIASLCDEHANPTSAIRYYAETAADGGVTESHTEVRYVNTYDGTLLTGVEEWEAEDGAEETLSSIEEWEYDELGRQVYHSLEQPEYGYTSYEYWTWGDDGLLAEEETDSDVTTFVYDSQERLVERHTVLYDDSTYDVLYTYAGDFPGVVQSDSSSDNGDSRTTTTWECPGAPG